MADCVVCQERERDVENNLLSCSRCAGRLAGALRQIPVLVDELRGLGYVERDVRPLACTVRGCETPAQWRGKAEVPGRPERPFCSPCALRVFMAGGVYGLRRVLPAADWVTHVLTAGPAAGGWRESRIRGTRPERVPISLDASDLTAPARAGSVAVHAGRYAGDQEGHLSAATVLDFWVRDWADLRGEGLPPLKTARERSPAGLLAGWLSDRLDWALSSHPALDEFARDVADLFGALFGAARGGRVRPKPMEADCPRCHLATLIQATPEDNIECVNQDCLRILSPEEYAEHVRSLIEEAS